LSVSFESDSTFSMAVSYRVRGLYLNVVPREITDKSHAVPREKYDTIRHNTMGIFNVRLKVGIASLIYPGYINRKTTEWNKNQKIRKIKTQE